LPTPRFYARSENTVIKEHGVLSLYTVPMDEGSMNKVLFAPRFALWISRLAVAFPFAAIGVARLHYALTSIDLSAKVQAWVLLLTFLFCLACVFDLVLASRTVGKVKAAIIGWSIGGIVLNVLFFVVVSIS
jgi:hypothetical protein